MGELRLADYFVEVHYSSENAVFFAKLDFSLEAC
jgi:hypothetical protein